MAGSFSAGDDIREGRTSPASILATLINPQGATDAANQAATGRTQLVQKSAVSQLFGQKGAQGTPNYYDYSKATTPDNTGRLGTTSIDQAATPLMGTDQRNRVLQVGAGPEFNAAALTSMIQRAFPAPEAGVVVPEGGTLVGPRSGKVLAQGAPKPVAESDFLRNLDAYNKMAPGDPRRDALGQWLQKNSTESDKEPLVQVPDPSDPTKGIYVPRSRAIGQQAFQTQRERMPKMQTYFDENGAQQQLDSNDPEDQKIIRAKGLVTTGPSDVERTSLGFVNRMGSAEGVLGGLTGGGYQPGGLRDKVAGGTPLIGNYAMSDEGQAYKQAQEDWVRAKLRKESGAVIGANEMVDEVKTYFPQPGDTPATIQQKAASRIEAQRQMATTAGILGKPRLRDLGGQSQGTGYSGNWQAGQSRNIGGAKVTKVN